MDQEQHLSCFRKLLQGMIEKDRALLEEALSKDAFLYHMTGLRETREEYIHDILVGTLNYYDYQILSFEKEQARVRLLAKVYGGSKSWWTLRMSLSYVYEDEILKIKESRVHLG